MPSPIRRFLFWFKASRPEFFTGSIVPVMVGGAMAYHDSGHFHWGNWVITLIALALLHAMANLSNDYYDHLSGNDDINTEYATPFTGGSRVIQRGEAAPRRVLIVSLLCMAMSALLGLYLVYQLGWEKGRVLLAIGVIGGLTGFLYTANPVKLGYRGFGEIFIGLDFGVLPVLGAYYVQVQHFSWGAFVASLPVALLIMAILWINQFQDYTADKAVNKLHWVVRLGRRRASYVYAGMMIATFVIIVIGVLIRTSDGARLLPLPAVAALIVAPLAAVAIRTAIQRCDDIPRLTPANAATVVVHLATGVLLAAGLVVGRMVGS